MKIEFLLIVGLLAASCESKQAQTVTPANDSKPVKRPIAGVSFTGGDGSSIKEAIIIKAPNNFVGIRGEYDWIKKNHPNWQLEEQKTLRTKDNRMYDKMTFRTPDRQRTTLYFDITDFFGKL
jgi:hypothetical protein